MVCAYFNNIQGAMARNSSLSTGSQREQIFSGFVAFGVRGGQVCDSCNEKTRAIGSAEH